MKNIQGKRIKQLIFAKGFCSTRSFAKYMREKYPEDYVTRDTISNAIEGKNMRKSTLESIAKTLEVSEGMLISHKKTKMDEYLEEMVQPLIEEHSRMEGEEPLIWYEDGILVQENPREEFQERFAMFDRFQDAMNLYDIEECFYPFDMSKSIINGSKFQIKTMAELLVYLPICDARVLTDILYRIGGSIVHYEEYIMEKVEYLYKDIPDIPAKRFIDCKVLLSRLQNKYELTDEESKLKKQLEEYQESEEYEEGYCQYYSALKNNCDLVKDWQFEPIIKSRYVNWKEYRESTRCFREANKTKA